MKLALSILALVASFSTLASSAQASEICGTVIMGQCDVDVCQVGLSFTNAKGQADRLGLNFKGERVIEATLFASGIEAQVGKKACGDTADIDATGAIDVSKLSTAN